MQIHEITQRKLDEGVGSFLGGLAGGIANVAGDFKGAISPGGDAKSAYASAVRPQQIKMLADKAYTGWKQYEKTLLQSNPDARTGDMYYQALLAFVTKNLLGGQYLPNVINRRQIETLVQQLSGGGGTVSSSSGNAPVTVGGQKLDPNKPEEAKIIDALRKQGKLEEAESPALTPQQEKDLWLKLTQQAAVATTQAPGTRTGGIKSPVDDPVDDNTAGDARSYVGQMQADAKIQPLLQQLSQIGPTYGQTVGSQRVKSTGNPAADALLLMAGFRGI
jgi:hypothetical protein